MNADASMPELANALSGMGAQMRAIGSQAANLSTTLQNDVQAISDKLGEINDTVFAAMDELENRDLVTDGSQTDPDSITLGAVRSTKVKHIPHKTSPNERTFGYRFPVNECPHVTKLAKFKLPSCPKTMFWNTLCRI